MGGLPEHLPSNPPLCINLELKWTSLINMELSRKNKHNFLGATTLAQISQTHLKIHLGGVIELNLLPH